MADLRYAVSESDLRKMFEESGLPADFQRYFIRDYATLKKTSDTVESDLDELTIVVGNLEDDVDGLISLDLPALISAYNAHAAATSAHGASGNIVGVNNFATVLVGGTVKLATAVADQATSTVSITSTPNAAAAGYVQADAATWVAMLNELKSDVNQLVADLNSLTTKVNTILASERTALQRAP